MRQKPAQGFTISFRFLFTMNIGACLVLLLYLALYAGDFNLFGQNWFLAAAVLFTVSIFGARLILALIAAPFLNRITTNLV